MRFSYEHGGSDLTNGCESLLGNLENKGILTRLCGKLQVEPGGIARELDVGVGAKQFDGADSEIGIRSGWRKGCDGECPFFRPAHSGGVECIALYRESNVLCSIAFGCGVVE